MKNRPEPLTLGGSSYIVRHMGKVVLAKRPFSGFKRLAAGETLTAALQTA